MARKFDPAKSAKLEDPHRLGWQHPDVVVDLLGLTGVETVVDYGAGTGVYTLPIAAALPRGRVIAVDLSRDLLDILESKLTPELAARVEIVATKANDVPLPDGAAEVVLAVNVWHELYDETEALAEMRRLLAPDGRLVIVDWAPIERPVGPPAGHVLSLERTEAVVASMGLHVRRALAPGPPLPYHYAVVAGAVAAL
jgi:ubiquinone/menaquinone biosynthesis C-methylase UbiE